MAAYAVVIGVRRIVHLQHDERDVVILLAALAPLVSDADAFGNDHVRALAGERGQGLYLLSLFTCPPAI